jgi:hypothetical protein
MFMSNKFARPSGRQESCGCFYGKISQVSGFFEIYKNRLTRQQKHRYCRKHEICYCTELLLFSSAEYWLGGGRAEVFQFIAAKAS